ncbi:MAG: hypothetical protein SF162_12140 [bacterium]|nr:hypothetical protein [bacterium]
MEAKDRLFADIAYDYATSHCTDCPAIYHHDDDCCKNKFPDSAYEFFSVDVDGAAALQLANEEARLFPDKSLIDPLLLSQCRKALHLRQRVSVPFVDRMPFGNWWRFGKALGLKISGRRVYEKYLRGEFR